jgi:hypothetical protein
MAIYGGLSLTDSILRGLTANPGEKTWIVIQPQKLPHREAESQPCGAAARPERLPLQE